MDDARDPLLRGPRRLSSSRARRVLEGTRAVSVSSPELAATAYPVVHEAHGDVLLRFDRGTLQSRVVPKDPARLVLEYTRLVMGFLLFQPSPARIAMIGLGGGSLARYCALKLPDADFTAIEISPEVIALRDTFGIPPDGPRFRVRCEDGAAFVRRDGEPLDVLIVDGFDRDGLPEALCTAAFYDCCRDRLAPGGVLVANLYADEAADHHVERIHDAFAGKVVVIEADDSQNRVVFAGTDAAFPPSFDALVLRLRALEDHHPVGLAAIARKVLQHREPRRGPRWSRNG
jgi:spermidine synthase